MYVIISEEAYHWANFSVWRSRILSLLTTPHATVNVSLDENSPLEGRRRERLRWGAWGGNVGSERDGVKGGTEGQGAVGWRGGGERDQPCPELLAWLGTWRIVHRQWRGRNQLSHASIMFRVDKTQERPLKTLGKALEQMGDSLLCAGLTLSNATGALVCMVCTAGTYADSSGACFNPFCRVLSWYFRKLALCMMSEEAAGLFCSCRAQGWSGWGITCCGRAICDTPVKQRQ